MRKSTRSTFLTGRSGEASQRVRSGSTLSPSSVEVTVNGSAAPSPLRAAAEETAITHAAPRSASASVALVGLLFIVPPVRRTFGCPHARRAPAASKCGAPQIGGGAYTGPRLRHVEAGHDGFGQTAPAT